MNFKRHKSSPELKHSNTFCFTDYFCNKYSCRSIANNKFNVLCKTNISPSEMFKDILKTTSNTVEPKLLLQIQPYVENVLKDVKAAFEMFSKDDFSDFFIKLKPKLSDDEIDVDPSQITTAVVCILELILPKSFFGNNKNKKVFYEFIRYILKNMSGQHVTFSKIINKWEIDEIEWMNFVEKLLDDKKTFLIKILIWIIKNTVCSIIAVNFYVTVTKLTHESKRLYYYVKSDWQRFTDRFIYELLESGNIIKQEAHSLGSTSKKKLSSSIKTERKQFLKSLPVMRLLLKSNGTVRVIIRYKTKTLSEKQSAKYRRALFQTLFPYDQPQTFEQKYLQFHNKWIYLEKPKLYFIKADLTDAFGSVDILELRKIIAKSHFQYQQTETNFEKKRFIAKEYKKLVDELTRPVLVRSGSCVYTWNRGLVQGMRFSPILCEIFYRNYDRRNIIDYTGSSLENEIIFLMRLVDDYLFITDNIKTACNFFKHMVNLGKINQSKSMINFSNDSGNYTNYIHYFGYVLNTRTMEVTRDETVYSGQICYRILFNRSISDPFKFLETRIIQTTVPLSPLYFNLHINSEETVWRNIFITLCISANKFCSILNINFCNTDDLNVESLFSVYKRKVAVRMCNAVLKVIHNNKPDSVDFPFCINHFRYLSFKALSLFACHSNICMKLLPLVKTSLKKTNCILGTWKSHHRYIDSHGKPKELATQHVCRSSIVKKCFKDFHKIPNAFAPYRK